MQFPVDLVRVELRSKSLDPAGLELLLAGGAIPMRCTLVRDGLQQHEFQLSWSVEELRLGSSQPCSHAGAHVSIMLRDGAVLTKDLPAGTLSSSAPVQLLGGDDSFQV